MFLYFVCGVSSAIAVVLGLFLYRERLLTRLIISNYKADLETNLSMLTRAEKEINKLHEFMEIMEKATEEDEKKDSNSELFYG